MKIMTLQERIELGQDINNAWTIVAAWIAMNELSTESDIDRWFPQALTIVRKNNALARNELTEVKA